MKPSFYFKVIAPAFTLLLSPRLSATQTVANNPDAVAPLLVGSPAPTRVLSSTDGPLDLGGAIAHKPTILLFYGADWCRLGNRELTDLRKNAAIYTSLGFQIIAISTDSPEELKATSRKLHAPFRLLSDRNLSLASDYGIVFRAPPQLIDEYGRKGISLPPIPGAAGAAGFLVPTVFVLDANGVIRWVYSNSLKNPTATELTNAIVRART